MRWHWYAKRRLLVDLRHEATHNELPSLACLRLAAAHALTWLAGHYWQRQTVHTAACLGNVSHLLQVWFGDSLALLLVRYRSELVTP